MKVLTIKVYFILLCFSSLLYSNNAIDLSHIDAIIIKDLKQNKILHQKNPTKIVSPASLTKILTSIVALESNTYKSNKATNVIITKEMLDVEPSKIGLEEGHIISLENLIEASLICSANDAAKAISIFLGQNNEKNFINMMNLKARKIGMKRSNFTNAAGFDIDLHISSAEDLLKLTEYAIKNPYFNNIVNTKYLSFKAINSNHKFGCSNHNKMLFENKSFIGIKTGFTKKAGPCLIMRSQKDNLDILVVMLNNKIAQDRWQISKDIMNYIYAKYSNLKNKS